MRNWRTANRVRRRWAQEAGAAADKWEMYHDLVPVEAHVAPLPVDEPAPPRRGALHRLWLLAKRLVRR